MAAKAIAAERGCGKRVKGGIYSECGIDEDFGTDLNYYLCDPPVPVPVDMEVPQRGVILIERGGTYHIVDRVGKQNYPNVADFIEEMRRLGMSRRLPRTLDFSKLTPQSRHLLVHDCAYINNWSDYPTWECPNRLKYHARNAAEGVCLGIVWEDIVGGEPATVEDGAEPIRCANDPARLVKRKMPSFTYYANRAPVGVVPIYSAAIFASMPISRLVVVDGDGADEAMDLAGMSHLAVEREDH